MHVCLNEVSLQPHGARWSPRFHPVVSGHQHPRASSPFHAHRRSCVVPLRGARKGSGAEIPEKWGKLTKFPSPVRLPKLGKITEKKPKNVFLEYFFPFFGAIFPFFRGSGRGGAFCNFSPFFGDFRPGGFAGPPSKGKNNSQPCFLAVPKRPSVVLKIACNLIWWAVSGFQYVMKQQELRRNKEKKAETSRKKKPQMANKNRHDFVTVFVGHF